MSQSQIKALTQRIVSLEDALTKLQQATVNTVATQIQALFTDPVMVESITHRMLASAANAIAHKAAQSNQRAPELTVLEGYIPGALRAIMNEDACTGQASWGFSRWKCFSLSCRCPIWLVRLRRTSPFPRFPSWPARGRSVRGKPPAARRAAVRAVASSPWWGCAAVR